MSEPRPPDASSSLRERTREEIFRVVLDSGPLTSVGVQELTGLRPSTVRHAIQRLLQERRLEAVGVEDKGPGSGSGRPSRYYRALPEPGLHGAIDFGQGHITVAVSRGATEPLAEETTRFDVRGGQLAAIDLAVQMLRALAMGISGESLSSVVAGVPAPIDRQTGVANSLIRGRGWSGLNPGAELHQRLGIPVVVENDAALGAYGEWTRGVGRGHRDILYLKASRGVGAALVLDGRPYSGADGFAGEIAHTELPNPGSELCQCGRRGCLGSVVSVDTIRHYLAENRPDVDAATVPIGSLHDDPSVQSLLEEIGRALGRVVAPFCNLINPSLVVLGGELGTSGSAFLEGVESSIARYGRRPTVDGLRVAPAELGLRAEIVGALQMSATKT